MWISIIPGKALTTLKCYDGPCEYVLLVNNNDIKLMSSLNKFNYNVMEKAKVHHRMLKDEYCIHV